MSYNQYPSFEYSRRTNNTQITKIFFIIALAVIFPTIGFLGAKRYIPVEKKPEVLGVSTTTTNEPTPTFNQSSNIIHIPIIEQDLDLQLLSNNPQLVIGAGGVFGFVSLLIAMTLIRNSLRRNDDTYNSEKKIVI